MSAGEVRIGPVDDIPLLEGRSVSVDGRRVAVFRRPDGFAAIDGSCPHKAGPLSDGIVADGCVTCPLHGWRFDLQTGEALVGDEGVTVHRVVERDGELWLTLAPAAVPAVA